MPTMQSGMLTTQNILQEAHVRDVDPNVFLREAHIAPIHAILQKLNSRPASSWKIEWFDDQLTPWTDLVNGNHTSSATTIAVDNPSYFNVDDYVKVARTGEIMGPVTSVGASNITVANRGAGETSAAALNDNDVLIILRGNIKEGGSAAGAIATKPVLQYNYLQRFSHTIHVSQTLDNVKLYWGSERVRQRQKKFKEHREAIELAILFGERFLDNTSSGPRSGMRGLLKWITTNVYTVAVGVGNPKNFTEDDWNSFLKMAFNLGGPEKTIFCSGEVLQKVSSFGLKTLTTRPPDKQIGIAVTSYVSPFGTVNLIHHRFLSAQYGLDWHAIALDLDKITWRPLIGTRLRPNIQTDLEHAIIDEFYTEATIEVGTEEAHGIFKVTE